MESGHLPVGYKGSVCEESEIDPFSQSFLLFALREGRTPQMSPCDGVFLLSYFYTLCCVYFSGAAGTCVDTFV